MAVIGYMEGTDSLILTKLVAEGHETFPLGNGWDNHGKYIRILNREDGINVVVGYLHKFTPSLAPGITPEDILYACRMHKIPVIIITDSPDIERARKVVGDIAEIVEFVPPDKVYDAIKKKI